MACLQGIQTVREDVQWLICTGVQCDGDCKQFSHLDRERIGEQESPWFLGCGSINDCSIASFGGISEDGDGVRNGLPSRKRMEEGEKGSRVMPCRSR